MEKYFYEITENYKIFHLLFANEGSKAGDYYNEFTLKFIEKTYQQVTNPKAFDIIESVKERFIEVSKEIIEFTGNAESIENNKNNKTNENNKNDQNDKKDESNRNIIQLKDFENIDKNGDKKIKLNKSQKITLKRCLIDELGFSNLKNNGFEPTYNYFTKDNTIEIRVEAPGNCKINSKIEYSGEYTIIKLFGEKKKIKNQKN